MACTSLVCSLFIFTLWLLSEHSEVSITAFAVMFGFWSGTAIGLGPVCVAPSVQDSGSWEEEWNNLRHSKLWGADGHSDRWRHFKSIWNQLLRAHHVWRCSVCCRIHRVCFHKGHCGRLGASNRFLISIVIHSTFQKVFVTVKTHEKIKARQFDQVRRRLS